VVEGNTAAVECVEQPFLVRANPAGEYGDPAVARVLWHVTSVVGAPRGTTSSPPILGDVGEELVDSVLHR
jgi:hypothetical protein